MRKVPHWVFLLVAVVVLVLADWLLPEDFVINPYWLAVVGYATWWHGYRWGLALSAISTAVLVTSTLWGPQPVTAIVVANLVSWTFTRLAMVAIVHGLVSVYRSRNRHAQRATVLAELSHTLALAEPDPTSVCDTAAALLVQNLGDTCVVLLDQPGSVELELVAVRSQDPEAETWYRALFEQRPRRKDDSGPLGRVFATGQAVVLSRVDPADFATVVPPEFLGYMDRFGGGSLAYVPLQIGERFNGVIAFNRFAVHPEPFSQSDLTLLHDVADRVAIAVDRARIMVMLRNRALHDPLTGLPNRHLFFDRLQLAIEQLRRHPGQLAVCYLDVNHFKEVNDRHGHQVGDHVLIEVGRRLARAVRTIDTVSRLAGDEFAVLCPDVESDNAAVRIADRILAAFDKPMTIGEVSLQVRVSVGVKVTHEPVSDLEALLRHADAAMYEAKRESQQV